MSQTRLERRCIVSLIGECATASVPQHMRVRLDTELRLDSSPLHHAGKPSGREAVLYVLR